MLTENPDVDSAGRRARRLSWVAMSAAVLSLALAAVLRAFGHPTPWTSWLLSTLLIANPAVYLLSQRRQRFRAAQVYYRVAAVASWVVLAGMIISLWHR